MSSDGIFSEILFQWLWVLGVILAATALLVGILLLLAPARMLRVADYLNREYSFINKLVRMLDRPHYIEPFIYRHHRVAGLVLAVFSGYFLWKAGTVFMPPIIHPILHGVLIAFNVIALLLGIEIFVRPSLLKRTERMANRWLSTEAVVDVLEKPINKPERLAHRYPRALGAVILAAVLYIVLTVAFLT